MAEVCDFRVIDESEAWIVVDKPAPLVVHPNHGQRQAETLLTGLEALLACELASGHRLSILTRLDRETSGLVLVAKHRQAARELSACLQQGRIHREYLAIVHGWPALDTWVETGGIRRAGEVMPGPIWLRQMVHAEGRSCRTRFITECRLRRGDRCIAVVRCLPETGRMHQIRVHLEAAGHPLVGDKIYGTDGSPYLERLGGQLTAATRRRLVLPRHALHANRLRLDADRACHDWHSPLAADLAGFLDDSGVLGRDGDAARNS